MGARWAFALLAVLGASGGTCGPYGPAVPPPSKFTSAEQAIARYQDDFRHGVPPPCPRARPGEVVVCGQGRGGSAERVPLPDERTPPDHTRMATGEMPSGTETFARMAEPCDVFGCGNKAGVNLLTVPFRAAKIVHGLIDRDWAADHPDDAPAGR